MSQGVLAPIDASKDIYVELRNNVKKIFKDYVPRDWSRCLIQIALNYILRSTREPDSYMECRMFQV